MPMPRKSVDFSNKGFLDYLFGVICGDGCVNINSVSISCGLDIDYAALLKEEIEKELRVNVQIGNWNPSDAVVRVNSRTLSEYFSPKKYPKWDASAIEYKEEFLAGIFDTDGTIGEKWLAVSQSIKYNTEVIASFLRALEIVPFSECHRLQIGGYGPTEMNSIQIRHKLAVLRFSDIVKLRHPSKSKKLRALVELKNLTRDRLPNGVCETKILDLMRLQNSGLTKDEIVEGVGLSPNSISGGLFRLRMAGTIYSDGCHPAQYWVV